MESEKKKESKIKFVLSLLEELTYFVPHLVLAVLVATLFVDVDLLVTIALAIAYVTLCYGERFYHKLRIARDMLNNILQHINDVEKQINNQRFVTMNGLMKFAEIIDEEVDNKIEQLRLELNKGVADSEVDKEEQCQG